jgi:hypothetical protein
MNQLLRWTLHALAVLVPLALSAVDAAAQKTGQWEFVSEEEGLGRNFLRADSIVDEGNGVKLV